MQWIASSDLEEIVSISDEAVSSLSVGLDVIFNLNLIHICIDVFNECIGIYNGKDGTRRTT